MGALCGIANGAALSNAHVEGGAIQGGDSGSNFVLSIGGLVGTADDGSQIIASSASANVSDGGAVNDNMGGLVGLADNGSEIIASSASGNVSGGGDGADIMGGLVGTVDNGSRIVGSWASGNVSDGGDSGDAMGGLVGQLGQFGDNSQIIGSRASGNVSDGRAQGDYMGGLVGYVAKGIVRDSLSLGEVCDGVLTASCAAGDGTDRVGLLIGRAFGEVSSNQSEVYNGLALGQASQSSGDNVGFIGQIWYGTEMQLNAIIANNRFDTTAAGFTTTAGRVPSDVTAGNLTGIVGGTTAEVQVSTAYNTTWLATRWLFAASAYPRLLYFDYDPANPTTENPTASTTIDVCETITNNDPLEDQGEENMPDCGDVLEAWPRAQE